MSRNKRHSPEKPQAWLDRAKGNLAHARAAAGGKGVFWEDVCFDCQQAAEKALKGVLILMTGRFPRTHSIEELIRRIARTGLEVPKRVQDAMELTEYAVASRYPGDDEPCSEADFVQALRCAQAVVRWAGKIIRKGVGK